MRATAFSVLPAVRADCYCTVTVTFTECCALGDVAETWTIEITGGGALPPPQATANIAAAMAIVTSARARELRRLRPKVRPRSEATKSVPVRHGNARCLSRATLLLADKVKVTVLVVLFGVRLEGVKLQVTPAGRLAQAKVMAWLKTPCGAMVRAIAALLPRGTVMALEDAVREKSAALTVTLTAADELAE